MLSTCWYSALARRFDYEAPLSLSSTVPRHIHNRLAAQRWCIESMWDAENHISVIGSSPNAWQERHGTHSFTMSKGIGKLRAPNVQRHGCTCKKDKPVRDAEVPSVLQTSVFPFPFPFTVPLFLEFDWERSSYMHSQHDGASFISFETTLKMPPKVIITVDYGVLGDLKQLHNLQEK